MTTVVLFSLFKFFSNASPSASVGVAVLVVALSIHFLFHIQFGADDHYSDRLHPAGGAGSDFNFESWLLILSRFLIWENFEF